MWSPYSFCLIFFLLWQFSFLPWVLFQMALKFCFSFSPSLSELLFGLKNAISMSFQMNAISISLVRIPFPTSSWRISFGCREKKVIQLHRETWATPGDNENILSLRSTLRNQDYIVFPSTCLSWCHLTDRCDDRHVFYPLWQLSPSTVAWVAESLIYLILF